MKLCLRLLMPAAVLLLVLGATSAACGGDDELTLEEFFQQGQAIGDDFEERSEPLHDVFPYVGEKENEENLSAYKAFFGEFSVFFAEFLDELETLNPPSEAADAFDELLTTGRELVAVYEGVSDGIEGAESFAEAEQLLDESAAAFAVVQERYLGACQSLQKVADANGIVADLECSEGG